MPPNSASRIFAAAMAEGYRECLQRTAWLARLVPAGQLLTICFVPAATGDPVLDEGSRVGCEMATGDVTALLEGYLELSEPAPSA